MKKIFLLLVHELIIHNRINGIIRYNVQFISLGLIALIFIGSSSFKASELGIAYILISLPLSMISMSKLIIRPDISDGHMELLITTSNVLKIIIIKYISLFISNLISFILGLIILVIFYSISSEEIILILISGSILLSQITAFSLLLSCIEGYFKTNTNLISLAILPLLIPGLIISGLIISNENLTYSFIWILAGIGLIMVPTAVLLSEYLARNIYNT